MKALTITASCLTVILLVISNIELKFQQYAITIIRSSEANEESNHNVSSKSILEDIAKVILKDVSSTSMLPDCPSVPPHLQGRVHVNQSHIDWSTLEHNLSDLNIRAGGEFYPLCKTPHQGLPDITGN